VPSEIPFISCAQNREDVVLWRALKDVDPGRYVEIGANHPRDLSVTRSFYDRGWAGITVEPIEQFVEMHRTERPRDRQVQAAVTAEPVESITLFEIDGTGLSTTRPDVSASHEERGWAPHPRAVPARTLDQILDDAEYRDLETHFMVVDVEGAESQVLASVDLRRWRPWVVVVESIAPLSATQTHHEWEPILTAADYEFCLFDGVSRFYVAAERAARLRDQLSYPACALDVFTDDREVTLRRERDEALAQVVHWRTIALTEWADAVARAESGGNAGDDTAAAQEVEAMRNSTSWRITAPLRALRDLAMRSGRR